MEGMGVYLLSLQESREVCMNKDHCPEKECVWYPEEKCAYWVDSKCTVLGDYLKITKPLWDTEVNNDS